MASFSMYFLRQLLQRSLGPSLLLLLLLAGPNLSAVTLSSGLDRDTIRIGESAILTINYVGGSPSSLPVMPNIPNLLIERAGQSSQLTVINGQASSTLTLLYRLTPSQSGVFNIPGIVSIINGDQIPTSPIKLTVLGVNQPVPPPTPAPTPAPIQPAPRPAPPVQPPPQQPAQPEPTFIRMNIPRTEVYLGEIFPVEIALYYQSAQDIQLPNLRCEGFTVNRMFPQQQQPVIIGNARYMPIFFRTVAIPVKVGKLNFGPTECNLTVHIRRDAFSPLELKQMSPMADPVPINVLPLPTNGVPANFRGAVGNFSMVVSAGPASVTVGDPITLRVQISGRGALDNVLMPAFDNREFKAYEPVFKLDAPDILSMSGIKSFEQIVVPLNADVKEIPEISFSYFDPESKTYQTKTQPPIKITVRPHGGAVAQQPTILTNAIQGPPVPTDIVHIKTYAGELSTVAPPLLQRPSFLALQLLPIGAWLAAYLRRRKIENLANNPKLRRHREVLALVAKGLTELGEMARQNQTEAFFAAAFRLLQEQLGEKLDMPASAITEAIIDERLRPLHVSSQLLDSLHDAFQTCNQARYARQRTTEELISLANKFEKVLHELQHLALPR